MTNITRSPINGQIEADDIKSPNHYTWRGKECEEIIGEITQGAEGKEAYYLGAVVKYLYRYPKKGTPLKDLQKAKQYIDMLIKLKGGVNKMLSKLAIGAVLCGGALATTAAGVLIYATLPIELFMIFVGLMLAITGWLSWLFVGGF